MAPEPEPMADPLWPVKRLSISFLAGGISLFLGSLTIEFFFEPCVFQLGLFHAEPFLLAILRSRS